MAEAVKTVQKSTRGEGSTQRVDTASIVDKQTRKETRGKVTRTRNPVTTTAKKAAAESVSTKEPAVSTQQQTEDYGITVTFEMNIRNFLGKGGGC